MSSTTQAVIYCRVSSAKQMKHGDGLCSQETMCRHYAAWKGYEVTHVFPDNMTGKLIDRPGMQDLLAFLRSCKAKGTIVIVDELSRMAREIDAHRHFRRAIREAGAILECPSMPLGDKPHEKLQENIVMVMNEHWSDVVAERTRERQTARVINGYWPFQAPVGYCHEVVEGHQGKLLVLDEPCASIIREAFEGYASGRFQSQAEVMRFLEDQPDFPKSPRGIIPNEQVKRMLRNPIYAGYVYSKERNVSLRVGKHEPIISFETHVKIIDRMNGKTLAPDRKDVSEDFPLRNFVECGHCGTPLTSCWSKGKYQRFPYYLCPKKGCESYGKSIRRADLENEFERLLHSLQPTEGLTQLATAMFMDLWNHREAQSHSRVAALRAHVVKIDKEIDKYVDRIVEATHPTLREKLEERLTELERTKQLSLAKMSDNARPQGSAEAALRTSLAFLTNPWKLWVSPSIEAKRTVLKLAFTDRLAYVRNEGFRTPKVSIPFKVLAGFFSGEIEMAHPKRFELLTPRFVD